ncbi:MAG: pentapeptide repeat-containing protein [bacterium]
MDEYKLFDDECGDSFNIDEQYFTEKKFYKLELQETELREKEFYKCEFIKCNFLKSKLYNCDFEDCSFENCDISLWKLKNTKLIDVVFTECKLIGVDWTEVLKPLKANFYNSILNNNSFYALNLNLIKMINCNLHDVDFTDANLTKAKFCSSDLNGSIFKNNTLIQADFSDAKNYYLNPTENKIKKAVFTLPEALSLLSSFDIVIK